MIFQSTSVIVVSVNLGFILLLGMYSRRCYLLALWARIVVILVVLNQIGLQ